MILTVQEQRKWITHTHTNSVIVITFQDASIIAVYHWVPMWVHNMSSVIRKPAFCIYENKGADQLCGKSAADQHLYFHSLIKFNPSIF